jgi:hypothetical protein
MIHILNIHMHKIHHKSLFNMYISFYGGWGGVPIIFTFILSKHYIHYYPNSIFIIIKCFNYQILPVLSFQFPLGSQMNHHHRICMLYICTQEECLSKLCYLLCQCFDSHNVAMTDKSEIGKYICIVYLIGCKIHTYLY